jgi:hypothetical protein
MTAWSTPITWVNAGILATSMNSLRDNLLWLKGSVDLVTNGTGSDVGTGTYLSIKRAAAAELSFRTHYGADTDYRFRIKSEGNMEWGPGTGVRSHGLSTGANELRLDGAAFAVQRAGAGDQFLTGYHTGQSDPRIAIGVHSSGVSRIEFGGGSAATDAAMERPSAGRIRFPQSTTVEFVGGAGERRLDVFQSGENFPRFAINSGGNVLFGNGINSTDITLERGGAGLLSTPQQFRAEDGLQTFVFAGLMTDARFTNSPQNGMLAVNSSTNRLCVRIAGSWWGVNLSNTG